MSPFTSVVQESVLSLWDSIVAALPQVLGALVVFVIGLVLAVVLNRVIIRLVAMLKIDEVAAKLEVTRAAERAGVKLRIGALLGWIIKWFFIIVALIAATDILGWGQVTDFLKQIVLFVPNVIVAVIILLAGILLANFTRNVVRSAVEAARLSSAAFLSGLAKWAILVFSFMAALVQLQIAPDLIGTLFTGLVAMVALAGGLAFGLGGRDHAARVLERLSKDISSDHSSDQKGS